MTDATWKSADGTHKIIADMPDRYLTSALRICMRRDSRYTFTYARMLSFIAMVDEADKRSLSRTFWTEAPNV